MQKHHQRIYSKKKKISEYIIDETIIKVGSDYIWVWDAIEPESKEILDMSILKERNMFVTKPFLTNAVDKYEIHSVSTDWGTWYPQAYKFLKLYISSSLFF
ncbi:MAG TPA: DDE-type integrase/transposase/recombinase [Verrucomicrobiae bacterium]|nr:DDE-type integrase/transposase/recombinase [Verrucomicrobiae bacterium]